MMNVNLPMDTLLVWILVGLVAGFLASHVMLGHGMGILTDVVVGILGGLIGGFLATYFNLHIAIAGHAIISEMVVAFMGSVVLLLLLRLLGMSSGRQRA
jgi:uncharacterized membrane protein YeaQ/YmgE (transglycosylase-associated protein family)